MPETKVSVKTARGGDSPYRRVMVLPGGGRLTTEEVEGPAGETWYKTTIEGILIPGEFFPQLHEDPLSAISCHERVFLKARIAHEQWRRLRML